MKYSYAKYLFLVFSINGMENSKKIDIEKCSKDKHALMSALEVIDTHYGKKRFEIISLEKKKLFLGKFKGSWQTETLAPLNYDFQKYLDEINYPNLLDLWMQSEALHDRRRTKIKVHEFVIFVMKALHSNE